MSKRLLIGMPRFFSILIAFGLLLGTAIDSFAQPAGAPGQQRAGDIEQLQRDLKRIEAELEQLKRQAEKTPAKPDSRLVDNDAPSSATPHRLQESALEQLAREFRGELDYVNERVGVLNQKLDQRVGLSMYVTTEFEAIRHSKPEFTASKLELFPSIKLTDRLRAYGEIEFYSPIEGPSVNSAVGNSVELDQAWIEFTVNERVKPRAGVVLVPFGRFNLESFDPVQEFTSRPIYALKVLPSVWTEMGAGFTGRATLGSGKENAWFKDTAVEYQAYVLNGLDDQISSQGGLRDARGSVGRDNNHNKGVVGRVLTKLMPGIEIGVSGYYGSYDNTGKKIRGVELDLKLTHGPFELLAEAASFDLDPGGLSGASSQLGQPAPAYLRGGYIEGRYRFWFDWLKGTWLARGFDDPKFTALIRAEQSTVPTVAGPVNRESRLALGLNYRPVPTVAFKVEYQFNETTNETLVFGNNNGLVMSLTGAF